MEVRPDIHIIKDDKAQFYPEASRPALFAALHSPERIQFAGYVPIFRNWYSKPTRIFLVQGEGELHLPSTMLDEVLDDACVCACFLCLLRVLSTAALTEINPSPKYSRIQRLLK